MLSVAIVPSRDKFLSIDACEIPMIIADSYTDISAFFEKFNNSKNSRFSREKYFSRDV